MFMVDKFSPALRFMLPNPLHTLLSCEPLGSGWAEMFLAKAAYTNARLFDFGTPGGKQSATACWTHVQRPPCISLAVSIVPGYETEKLEPHCGFLVAKIGVTMLLSSCLCRHDTNGMHSWV